MNYRSLISGIFVSLLLSSCSDVKKPEYQGYHDLKIEKAGVKESRVRVQIDFKNPNRFGLHLKKSSGDVYLDGVLLGTYTLDSAIRISRQSVFTVPLSLAADVGKLMKNSMKALLGQKSLLEVKGSARVGKGVFYKTIPFTYSDTVLLEL